MKKSEILICPQDHKGINDWRRIFGFLDENLDYKKINSCLDLGAGLGNFGYFLSQRNPSCQVICADINQEYLKMILQRNPKIEVLLHDINQNLPFNENTFDLVSCIGTLHYSYVKDPEKVLKEMVRVSKKYIFVDFFSKQSIWVLFERIFYPGYNPRRYTMSQISRLIEKLNLKEIAKIGTRTIFPKLFPFSGKTVLFLLKKYENTSNYKYISS